MHCIITEKDTAARRIAAILSGGKAKLKKVGGINTYEFDDKVVIGLRGHIFQFDFPEKYKNWSRIDPYELIYADLVTVPIRKDVVKALEKIARRAERVTIATDYDREGELIGVEALSIVKRVNPAVAVDRMRFSAITEKDIKESFASRTEIDFNLAAAAEAREIIDLIWGATLTRFFSLAAQRLGKDFLSVGRVQSPTLALLVDREREIATFVPQKYWEIHAHILSQRGKFEAKHPSKFSQRSEAEKALARIKSASAVIAEVREKERREKPPTPFDTTAFILSARRIGFSPKRAMDIAENLYLRGLISYHRTDNTVYPATIDLRGKVKMLTRIPALKPHAEEILRKKRLKPTEGKKKTTDHPPIHPVSVPSSPQAGGESGGSGGSGAEARLSEEEWRIYELVARRFLATLSDDAVWKDTVVRISAGGEMLVARGKELKNAGFLAVYTYAKRAEQKIPPLREGETVRIEKVEIVEKETEPPKRISQASLVKKMEELGIGTKSTRHEIISKLYERKYLKGDPAKPTEKAIALIELLRKYAPVITKADMTRALEQEMEKISEGTRSKEEVVSASREMLVSVFKEMETHRTEIGEALKEAGRADENVGACPECSSRLIIRSSRRGKRFIRCEKYPECSFSLPLPAKGRILVTEEHCDVHPSLLKLKIVNAAKGASKGSGGGEKGKSGRRSSVWDFGCPLCNFLRWKEENEGKNEGQK
ncbi:MAG: DNA topoisomerase I [Candidatus Methanospirare jalkutatii]|nr:DNA topoisomerase I [Candidatus Methanospirare jalkutatii]